MAIGYTKEPLHYASSGSAYARHGDNLQRIVFDGTSRVTNVFPRAGARFLDVVFRVVMANPLLALGLSLRNRLIVGRLRSFRRFLIVPDIHIGDAVIAQGAATALRDFFPEARVDFVINRSAAPLIEGNPEVSRILPFFEGGSVPSERVIQAIHHLAASEGYDLILNLCPYIKDAAIHPAGTSIINIMSQSPAIIENEWLPEAVNHFIYHMYRLPRDLIRRVAEPARHRKFRGVRLTLADAVVRRARDFAVTAGAAGDDPVVMFNPDAASPYTRIPFEIQASLLARLAATGALILLGEGLTVAGLGPRLRATLPARRRAGVRIIPAGMPLDVYAALTDWSDVFISGDTGPLHLAAARKCSRSGRCSFRNRTSVLSIFGATPARMSGYDSVQGGYLPANQDAPSWCYTAGSPCRNISCLNKIFKTCPRVRCFEDFDEARVAGWVESRLNVLSRRSPRGGPGSRRA